MRALLADLPVIVAGPCVLEHNDLNLRIAEGIAEIGHRLGVRVIFKGSFDKANRSRLQAARGPGLAAGLQSLNAVRDETGLPVLTDVHQPDQVAAAAQAADVLQVPAFLCRQTDLLLEVGRSGCPVNVKKGQFMAPADMIGAVEKVQAGGSPEVSVTERGTFFGYGDLVVDMRNFERIREVAGVPVLFDLTHSVQQPGRGLSGASAGCREHAPALGRAAAAAGADGFYIETHPTPMESPSDAGTVWPLSDLESLLAEVLHIWTSSRRPAPV